MKTSLRDACHGVLVILAVLYGFSLFAAAIYIEAVGDYSPTLGWIVALLWLFGLPVAIGLGLKYTSNRPTDSNFDPYL